MKHHVHTGDLNTALNPGTKGYAKFACLEQRYGVTGDQIRKIIAVVGNSPEKVEDYLKGKLFSFLAYAHN